MAQRPVRLLLLGLLVGVLGACGASGPPGGVPPLHVPVTGAVGTTATCPAGSDPDASGPAYQARPRFPELGVSAAFDRQSGRVVLVDHDGGTWTYNVCANIWESVPTRGAASAVSSQLFYDAVDDLTYAVSFGNGFPAVRTFSVETSAWRRVQQPPDLWKSPWDGAAPRFVMDPSERVIYGYQTSTGDMRAYDIATNTWAVVRQSEPRPPKSVDALAGFDPSVGRIVLYVGYNDHKSPDVATGLRPDPDNGPLYAQTWTFDPATGSWVRVASTTPVLLFGYLMAGTEITYDEASREVVVFADAGLAVLDGTTMEWSVAQPSPDWPTQTPMPEPSLIIAQPDGTDQLIPLTLGPLARHAHGLVDDTVNGRVLVLGGRVRTGEPAGMRWREGTDVWAYDVAANAWTELVPVQPN